MPANFKINNEQYTTPSGWHEITFNKFLDYLADVAPLMPGALKNFIKQHISALGKLSSKLTPQQKEEEAYKLFTERWEAMKPKEKKLCYDFFAIEVGFWCGIDVKVIKSAMNLEQLEQVFWLLQYEMNPNNAEADENFVGFDVDGVLYLPPKQYMRESTVDEFATSAQFQEDMREVEGGNWKAMLDIMAVICRPEGEQYTWSQLKHDKRKKLFRQVTMDNVINVAFFLLRLSKKLNQDLQIYTMEAVLSRMERETLGTNTDGQA